MTDSGIKISKRTITSNEKNVINKGNAQNTSSRKTPLLPGRDSDPTELVFSARDSGPVIPDVTPHTTLIIRLPRQLRRASANE